MEEQNQNQEVEQVSGKGRLVRMSIGALVILVFAGVLFLFKEPLVSLLEGVGTEQEELIIAYSESFTLLSPLNYEVRNRNFIGNVYEGLTRFDKNLAVEPALAVSWGKIDDTTWEFNLRDSVYFHDGTTLDSTDVVSSIEHAMQDDDSQLKSLLSLIESVSAVDDKTVKIVTAGADPILPNRLVHVYIFPSEVTDLENTVVGTGPYYVVFAKAQEMSLKKFPYYWGFEPVYDDVRLVAVSSDNVEDAIEDFNIPVFVNVPIESVSTLEGAGFTIQTQPSLDLNFLLFNSLEGSVFGDVELREAFFMALNREELVSSLGEYASVIDQFAGKGVNGYDSMVTAPSYDPDSAKVVFEEKGISKFTVYMVSDMEELGDFLVEEFSAIGIDANIEYVDSSDLQDGILGQVLDVYFMGWKCDLGDIADLYEMVFHTKTDLYGAYNGGYSNSQVDALIEEASIEENFAERLSVLKEIAHVLIEDDVAGVPLFESEVIYGFKDGVSWSPRVDGYLWASDIE